MKRVVVTGAGGCTALGESTAEIFSALERGESGLRAFHEWSEVKGIRARVAGVIDTPGLEARYDRKKTRTMSRAALLGVRAVEGAFTAAGLLLPEHQALLQGGRVGVAFGSCLGGPDALMQVALANAKKDFGGIGATTYTKVMSHACAANVSLFFGLTGRLIPTCSACTSGSQAIGFSYETIQSGAQTVMVAGGAEELCIGLVGLFDSMNATAVGEVDPASASKPFSMAREGLVVSEGSSALVLEEYEHARARGAPLLAEVVGFGTNTNGSHITNPDAGRMAETLRLALRSSGIPSDAVGYVHAHATATELGDIAEAEATHAVLGEKARVGALKSYFGHTLGAAGALEAWLTIEMMRQGRFAPIRNLAVDAASMPDPRCAPLHYLKGEWEELRPEFVMTNNFAFGGVNTSLIFRAIEG